MGLAQDIEKILHPETSIDLPEEERRTNIVQLFEHYKNNTVLRSALFGVQSVSQKQQDITKKYHNPLPHSRPTFNEEQNTEVHELEKIVGDLKHLHSTKGFCLNNISDSVLGTLGVTGLSTAGVYIRGTLINIGMLGFLVGSSVVMGLFLTWCYNNDNNRRQEAESIDTYARDYQIATLFKEKGYL